MSKSTKKFASIVGFGVSILALTSCNITKPLCSPIDKAQQMYNFYTKNVVKNEKSEDGKYEIVYDEAGHTTFSDSFKDDIAKTNIFLPSEEYTNFIDDKVNNYIKDINNFPSSIIKLNTEENKDLFNTVSRAIALFGGYVETTSEKTANPEEQVLWHNYDKWTQEYIETNKTNPSVLPSETYLNTFKTSVNNNVAMSQACITPEDGVFQSGNVFVEGKTWGEAFTEYGFLEGLFVYPIGVMLHTFSKAFGETGIGQIFAIFFVTLIVRAILIVFTIFTSKSQTKMTELQPQIEALKQKYPDQEDKTQKQMLSQETMKLYKKNGVRPFLQFVVLLIQFPIFIFVWAALQGSAILTNGSLFGLDLTAALGSTITSWAPGAAMAIIMFVLLCISQFISVKLPQWFQTWQTQNFVHVTVKTEQGNKQQNTMKMVSWVMIIVVCFMGFSLPAAMAIYWFFGAIISIVQTIITQMITTKHRHGKRGGGDGSTLASERRSKNHTKNNSKTLKAKSIRSSR